jgi:hypothetical protein
MTQKCKNQAKRSQVCMRFSPFATRGKDKDKEMEDQDHDKEKDKDKEQESQG